MNIVISNLMIILTEMIFLEMKRIDPLVRNFNNQRVFSSHPVY